MITNHLGEYLHCGGSPAAHSRTEHLFTTTHCQNVSLIEKITIFFFHLITLCIPLIIYHARANSNFHPIRKAALQSIEETRKEAKPYPKEFNALDMAKAQIQKMSPLNPCPTVIYFRDRMVNTAIPLIKRAADYKRWELESLLKKQGEKAWETPQVLKVADEAMELGYTVACLTYDDLPAFQKQGHPSTFRPDKKRCKVEILSSQHSYHSFGTQPLTNIYHTFLRSAPIWVETKRDFCVQKKTPREWSAKFYTPGTLQHKWRTLFNAFADHAAQYVDLEKLSKDSGAKHGDHRVVQFLPKDLDDSFQPKVELHDSRSIIL